MVLAACHWIKSLTYDCLLLGWDKGASEVIFQAGVLSSLSFLLSCNLSSLSGTFQISIYLLAVLTALPSVVPVYRTQRCVIRFPDYYTLLDIPWKKFRKTSVNAFEQENALVYVKHFIIPFFKVKQWFRNLSVRISLCRNLLEISVLSWPLSQMFTTKHCR